MRLLHPCFLACRHSDTYRHDNISHVYRTTDLGQTWQSISGNLPDIPANDLIVDPDLDSTLYLATDVTVFYTTNLGNTWYTLGYDLPTVAITDLVFHQPSRKLVAATYGRSMFTIDLSVFTAAEQVQATSFSVSVFPNLVSDHFIVIVEGLPSASLDNSDLSFKLLNEKGIIVWSSSNYKVHSGTNAFQFSAKEILHESENGIFFLKARCGGKEVVKKIVLVQ